MLFPNKIASTSTGAKTSIYPLGGHNLTLNSHLWLQCFKTVSRRPWSLVYSSWALPKCLVKKAVAEAEYSAASATMGSGNLIGEGDFPIIVESRVYSALTITYPPHPSSLPPTPINIFVSDKQINSHILRHRAVTESLDRLVARATILVSYCCKNYHKFSCLK